MDISVRDIGPGDLPVVTRVITESWGGSFYQRYGFDLVALHRNAMDRVRAIKPDIPAESDGIPIRHELELELLL
ncbi:hypothetical protein [Nonomuraea sp. GTA35]|uniref:hypothetical protein n=1 Tax=Nonomuraea sp. GTA35 TaxID=1676746 RepID=UPI0035BFDF30